jgi:hypothetical protein
MPQNEQDNGSSISAAPRSRSGDIDRVESDRQAAVDQAAQKAAGQSRGGRQGPTNISTNVVNNSQAVIKNKPSAGSEPDNVSDTIMTNWAP